MALDTGGSMQEPFTGAIAHEPAPTPESLAFAVGVPFGSGLRAAREYLGLTLQDVADITKIRRAYLAAIEAMDLSQLPSRPFAIGYVRAYADALHLDHNRAVARFKEDAPERDGGLRNPIGVTKENDPRVTLMALGGAIVLAAIVIWNVAQRAMRDNDAPPEVAIITPAPTQTPGAPATVALGSALPPPVEATVPAPYITPGLPGNAPVKVETPLTPRVQGPAKTAYGAAVADSQVTLQAVHNITLVVRVGTKPLFGQVLSTGESYRAPNTPGLSFEVSNPQDMDVFVAGQYKGALTLPLTPISTLLASVPKPAAPSSPVTTPLAAGQAVKPATVAIAPAKPATTATIKPSVATPPKPAPPKPPKPVEPPY
jgi:cytoskeleton protein RodZ